MQTKKIANGREDSIQIIDLSHAIVNPRDAASGLSDTCHLPITLSKEIEGTSPIFMHILTQNENITEWRLDFWRPSRSGKEFQFYTIELINASIVEIQTESQGTAPPTEHIQFIYETIIWTSHDSNGSTTTIATPDSGAFSKSCGEDD